MPVDYSKWDNLELSDDSDIECHPNVDKKSFIRAMQNKIHMDRDQRKLEIKKLKYERIINDCMIQRITAIRDGLKKQEAEARAGNPSDVAFKIIFECKPKNEQDDMLPSPPEGVQSQQADKAPSYTRMMATMLDQVNEALDQKKPADRYQAMVEEVGEHLQKVQELQQKLQARLDELEKLERTKITSESYHDGFDSSSINKSKPEETVSSSAKKSKAKAKSKGKVTSVELLNPGAEAAHDGASKGEAADDAEEADDDDDNDDDDDDDGDEKTTASPLAKEFGVIKAANLRESQQFLGKHPAILQEKETDALLILAFDAELENRSAESRNFVHQALLLQYCRVLGADGVRLFFTRITNPTHQARRIFYDDVNDTYGKIKTRAAAIREQMASSSSAGVEQIQLHPVEPGTELNITIPPANSDDPEVRAARAAYDSLLPRVKKALETGSLDEVNKVLATMTVEEAEGVVEKLSDAQVLSLDRKIIDTTTEEGKQELKELKEDRARETAEEAEQQLKYGDPE